MLLIYHMSADNAAHRAAEDLWFSWCTTIICLLCLIFWTVKLVFLLCVCPSLPTVIEAKFEWQIQMPFKPKNNRIMMTMMMMLIQLLEDRNKPLVASGKGNPF